MGEAEAGRLRPVAQPGAPPQGSAHPVASGAAGGDLLARVVDGSVDGILAFDRDCRYTLWNAAMERLTGVTRQRAVGASAFELFPFLEEIGEDRYLREALAGNTVVSTDRQFRVLESGREGWFEGHYSPLYGAGGEVVGGVAVIRDIT